MSARNATWSGAQPRRWMSLPPPYTHNHPKPDHVMNAYRRHLQGCRKKWGRTHSLIHRRALVTEYAAARAVVRLNRLKVAGWAGSDE